MKTDVVNPGRCVAIAEEDEVPIIVYCKHYLAFSLTLKIVLIGKKKRYEIFYFFIM